MRHICDSNYAAAASNSFAPEHVLLYSLRYLCALSACTSCCPSAATLPTAACSAPLVHLLGSPTRCVGDSSAPASLVAPPTCAAVPCCAVLCCASPSTSAGASAAADVLSRLVSIGGVALALQLRLTTPLLQSFPAPNYYVSCRVSASLTHARP